MTLKQSFIINLKQKKNIEQKLKKIYFDYFTDYLVFSEYYNSLLEENKLDEFIKSDYIYYLYGQVKDIETENLYPSDILSNFLELTTKLESRTEKIRKEYQTSLKQIFEEMKNILYTKINDDQTEIYYVEYIKRHSKIENFDKMMGIPVSELKVEMQEDFLYLHNLMNNIPIKIDSNFYSFLQKLMIDFPEIMQYPPMLKNAKQLLSKENTKESADWLHLLSDKNIYRNNLGVSIETTEILYCSTIIKKIIFSKDPSEEIEKIDKKILYSLPFYYCLSMQLETYTNCNQIIQKEKTAFQELINVLRNNKEQAEMYKKDFQQLINEWIVFLNTSSVEKEDEQIYIEEILHTNSSVGKWLKASPIQKKYIKAQIEVQIELENDIMNYLLFPSDKLKNELLLEDKELINAITSLFNDYSRLFFDETIYNRINTLLENNQTNEAQKLKTKINNIRKG